jgi:peptidyl-prolyl cis-trans isomerase B (cyclophilin B)
VKYVALFLLALCGLLGLAFLFRPPQGPNPIVLLQTNKGDIKIELFQDKAPISTANFLHYVDTKFYDGTIFHRVIADFMIQGGGFTPGLLSEKKTDAPIRNESYNGLKNERGTLAMARTGDPNSATSQFFINVKDNPALDRPKSGGAKEVGYAVFGKVIDGMDVVEKIRAVDTHRSGGHDDVPVDDVVIISARRVEAPAAAKK